MYVYIPNLSAVVDRTHRVSPKVTKWHGYFLGYSGLICIWTWSWSWIGSGS